MDRKTRAVISIVMFMWIPPLPDMDKILCGYKYVILSSDIDIYREIIYFWGKKQLKELLDIAAKIVLKSFFLP